MQATFEAFLRALRAVDVRVSPAEAIEAHRAALAVGWDDRGLLRDALCVTLAKSADEVARFETCFDTFFQRRALAERGASPLTPPPDAPPLAQMLLENDPATLAGAMEAAAAAAGASDIRLNTQRALLTRRLLDGMGLRELEAMINRLRAGEAGDQALAEALAERRAALFEDARALVERQARLYAGESGRRLRETILAGQRLTAIDPDDMAAMQTLVRRVARRLASRYARKRRAARRGKLDVRQTIRRSMHHGGVPFDIVWKRTVRDKPRIVVVCDVSRSVASAAQFLLLFLHSLNEVVERLDAFAFSDCLVDVGDLLDDETVDDAVALILKRIGMRSTDYGRALEDLFALHAARLDRRTTVIVLGDGRTNHVDPRLDLMRRLSERVRAVIWLNPEPRTYWGQGDSRMDAYARFCSVATTCNTLTGLERIIDEVLRSYLAH